MPSFAGMIEKKPVRITILLVLAILAAVSVIAGVRNAVTYSQDFQWDAAKALAMRLDPYELSRSPDEALKYPELEAFYRMFTDRGLKQKMEANQFPSLLMLLSPMTLFAPDVAKIIWCILNLAFTAGIVILLKKTFFDDTDGFVYAVITLLMIAGTPYRNQIGVGQHTLFAFFFFMLAVYVDKRPVVNNPVANGLLVTLCLFVSYFKYTLTAPLALYFLYRKRYIPLTLSVAGHVILTECAAIWIDKSFIYMIKAPLTVASALASEGGIDLGVIIGGKASFAVAFVIAVLITVMTFMFPAKRDNILFSVLILWSLVLTYHRTYDFFVLSAAAMVFCPALEEAVGRKVKNTLMCWYVILLAVMYFGLRIFNENIASKTVAGVIYYAFTIALSLVGAVMIRKRKNG